ncbi:hypothetical protein [Tenacibaculum finnmarkense]|uniref:hypothetical protein n=1 Tax=Tenacibaculum finnmarkense TaxID=2781243 RepID=UPI00187B8015|nr:hypothetical protein [Tenacibaculum finnmarkense]MBE7635165.1 hypothetical protein [Tenacibaculum finnmarkense genomovar ulcerans]MCD8401395.1 hypothetical protein [Tenacibaculum finnmarkense genomovar ulcerans]MCD8423610.1 hypothetical protein [Tenacibaculum finnmarkense genomovar ulcerans]MCD8431103.1 hypothetical protein [Tenacibaculum finnmarkense genomovar ulcerans]MCD8433581.1 hypothetical protein [Tenacibaculum finnmarkense genomovar ulcerans]
MKKYIVILILVFLSCSKQQKIKQQILEKGLITEKGVYYNKYYKITVKEFYNGTLTYAVSDKKNNLLYQHNILEAFSKHLFWSIYWDGSKLWVYNSDYDSKIVWVFDNLNRQYIKKDFCKLGIKIPIDFEDFIKNDNIDLCK